MRVHESVESRRSKAIARLGVLERAGNPGLTGLGTLVQGSVEASNVNVVEEMVNMIETQRAYEMNTKAIQSTDSMLQNLSQNL